MSKENSTVLLINPGQGKEQRGELCTQIEKLLMDLNGKASLSYIENKLGNSWPRTKVLLEMFEMMDLGILSIEIPCYSEDLKKLYSSIEDPSPVCNKNPGLWNIVWHEKTLGKRWQKSVPFYKNLNYFNLKEFEKDVYLSLIEPFISPPAKVLDAGCGIGRFSTYLASKGYFVFLLDGCFSRLIAAVRRMLQEGYANFDLYWAELSELSMFEKESFETVFAIETICYCTHPTRALAELVRVTKKGGILVISVEAPFGAISADSSIGIEGAQRILTEGSFTLPHEFHTKYFTRSEFREMLEDAGLDILLFEGTHYFLEGIFSRQTEFAYSELEHFRPQLMELEEKCRRSKHLSEMARAWLAVTKVR